MSALRGRLLQMRWDQRLDAVLPGPRNFRRDRIRRWVSHQPCRFCVEPKTKKARLPARRPPCLAHPVLHRSGRFEVPLRGQRQVPPGHVAVRRLVIDATLQSEGERIAMGPARVGADTLEALRTPGKGTVTGGANNRR
jgi:hypothetical protein